MFDYDWDLLKNQKNEPIGDSQIRDKKADIAERNIYEKKQSEESVNTNNPPEEMISQPIQEEKKEIEFRLVGQLFDTYIIIEVGEEMRIIDQHAAHERLKFEELKKEAQNRAVYSQGLAIPTVVQLTSVEAAIFEQNADFICSLGFDAENYGENNVIIRSVPTGMLDEDIGGVFVEIIQQLEDNKREIITEKKERL